MLASRGGAVQTVLLTACAASDSQDPMSEGQFIDWKSAHLFVRDQGAADGPPVLLIHGAASNSSDMQISLVPALSHAYRVISYDRPGLGRSRGRPYGAGRLAGQAEAAARVIAAMLDDRPVVVGHSFGGAVALRLALDYPDKVRGLVLIGAPSHQWPGNIAWYNYASTAPLIGSVFNRALIPLAGGRAARSGAGSAFGPQVAPPGYYDRADVGLLLRPAAFRANSDDLVGLKAEIIEQAPRYEDMDMPVAILHGEADDTVHADLHAERMAEDIPGSRLTLLPGMGHMLHHFRPRLVVENIEWVIDDAGS